VTYEVVGTPGRLCFASIDFGYCSPGVTRKIMEFNTGKQNNPIELPPNN